MAIIERCRNHALEVELPYVYLDGIILKRVAMGVETGGYQRFLGVCEGREEDKAGWLGFLKQLNSRGLRGVRLVISDASLGSIRNQPATLPPGKSGKEIFDIVCSEVLQ